VNSSRGRDERGAETIEVVLVTPVLLLLLMLIVQFALWYHASHVAEAAAQQGTSAARVETGTADDGRDHAQQFMANAAPALVEDVVVTATRDTEVARVEVTGTVDSLIPGLTLHVHGDAQSSVERFRAETR
jgi:Flp pilus assembly protein TadG